MEITKDNYLKLRTELINGTISESSFSLFYEYWKSNRKDEYKNPEYDEFCNTFNVYLRQGMNFNSILNTIIPYYDNKYSLTTVTDKNGKILTTF